MLPLIFPLRQLRLVAMNLMLIRSQVTAMAIRSSPVLSMVWFDRVQWVFDLQPEPSSPGAGRRQPNSVVGPLSASMRHVVAEGRDHRLWLFATRKVAACWRLLRQAEGCLSPTPRWVTFGHADATRHRTGQLGD